MRTSEFDRMVVYVCALMAGVSVICGGQAAFGADDPNAMWDPATHLAPRWQSVSLTTQVENNSERFDPCDLLPDLRYSRTLSISGEVDITDSDGLIAFTSAVTGVIATDETGRVIHVDAGSGFSIYQGIRVDPARAGRVATTAPYRFATSIPMSMSPNVVYPQLIGRLEWSWYVLIAGSYEVVDVPFKVTQDWVPLVPGMEILVEEASAEGNKYQYRIQARYNADQVAYVTWSPIPVRAGEELADRMVIETQILNAQGQPVGSASSGYNRTSSASSSGSGEQRTYTLSGNGTCADCGTATTFRYRFAVNPYQQEVRLVLKDIPVPSF